MATTDELPDELPGENAPAAGRVIVTKRAVFVTTATGPVRLGMVQAHGKKPMPAPDWARGSRIEPGERLGDD